METIGSDMETIGNNMKQLRQKLGCSQRQVAEKLGISTPAYCKIESGMTTINIARFNQIAKFYKVTPTDLMLKEEKRPQVITYNELGVLKEKLSITNRDLINLQSLAIKLFEELREK